MNTVYRSTGLMQRRGFTLMEIMVVIIVIAVLASVAGPMIGSITDQGKASATKATMQTLKTAFVNYANDMGRFPHNRSNLNAVNFNDAWGDLSCLRVGYNCPFTDVSLGFINPNAWNNMNIVGLTYSKRWKGPYFDGNPESYFVDAWGSNINVAYQSKGLWARSAGPDGTYQTLANVITPTYGNGEGEDDIAVSLGKVKF